MTLGIHPMKDCKIYFDKYNLSGDMNEAEIMTNIEGVDRTVFGDDTRRYLAGLNNISGEFKGFWQAGTDLLDDALYSNIALANKIMSIAPETGADGEVAYILRGVAANYNPQGTVGALITFGLSFKNQGENMVRATIMGVGAKTVTGNGVARQLGLLGTGQKLYAALHCVAVSGGTPTLDVKIESDDAVGMGSAIERVTFAQLTAPGSEWKTLDGPIANDDYWRLVWTITGSTPSFTILGSIGIM